MSSLPVRPPHHRITALRLTYVLAILLGLVLSASAAADDGAPHVALLRVDGAITPPMATYIGRGINRAADRGDTAVILEMDTPGGLSSAMDDIISDILNARLPVIVYVAPDGARAASAGTYITYAAHVAAMAPTTNIGSATPINLNQQEQAGNLTTEQKKVINDAAAKIRGLAEKRNRNADWAEQAVRDAANITASQAVSMNVVDFIASDRNDLLAKADGRMVEVQGQMVPVRTAGATIQTTDMSIFDRILQTVSDPNIAYILLSLGSLALVFELANPGLIFPGVLGGLMLVTGFYSLGTLNGDWSGLALIAFAFVLFAVDVFVPTHGTLTAGGIGAFLFGSLLLANSQNNDVLRLSRALVAAVTLTLGLFFALIVFLAARTRSRPPASGASTLIGMTGEVRRELNPVGMVFLNGELWEAVSLSGTIELGRRVVVTAVHGLSLTVAPIEAVATEGITLQGQH